MKRHRIIAARQALLDQLPVTGELLRGSLIERILRHRRGLRLAPAATAIGWRCSPSAIRAGARGRSVYTARGCPRCEAGWPTISSSRKASRQQNRATLSAIYGKLLAATGRVVGQAKRFAREIAAGVKRAADPRRQLRLVGLRQQLERMLPRVGQVMRQARPRIVAGDTHAEGKIVSIFEPSTEVIRKGKASKPTEFGKMVKLQEAENQIIIAYEVYDRRPSDGDLLIPAIEIHEAKLGRTPRLVAGDAAFYSRKNEAAAQSRGVKRVCIPIAPPKAPRANASKRSAGSATARNGAPDARDASASSNAGTASPAVDTRAMTGSSAGSGSASSPTTSSPSLTRAARNPPTDLTTIGSAKSPRPARRSVGLSARRYRGSLPHPKRPTFAPESS